tara:strand:+ start:255 stop:443 length:189 start_codon:yes stop_codon:yes gene_type:complete
MKNKTPGGAKSDFEISSSDSGRVDSDSEISSSDSGRINAIAFHLNFPVFLLNHYLRGSNEEA